VTDAAVSRSYSALGSFDALERQSRSVTIAGHGRRARSDMGGQLYVKQSSAEGADRAVTWAVTRWFQCLSRHFQWPPGWSCSAGGRGRLAGPGLITGSDATLNPYAPKHNPAIFFDGIEGAAGVWSATSQSAECLANDTPAGTTGPDDMSIFNAATEAGTVARYNVIVPNLCEDAHDSCNQPPGTASCSSTGSCSARCR
jgi:hypothetical protein